ncbi:hypothetical protein AAC387_Pa02g2610 [Persea americana]
MATEYLSVLRVAGAGTGIFINRVALSLSNDVREQLDLFKKQCARSKTFVDPTDEALRSEILKFIENIEN